METRAPLLAHVEAELDDVAVLDDVSLAFDAELALFLGGVLLAAFEVGVDDVGGGELLSVGQVNLTAEHPA